MLEIPLSSLGNQELYTLGVRIESILKDFDANALGINPYADGFLSNLNIYKNSSEKQAVSAREIAEKDGIRDSMYIALRNQIRNFEYHPEASMRDKSRQLMGVLNKNGKQIYTESYSVETAIIEEIIAEFDKKYLGTLDELGATMWYDFLKNAQTAFENTVRGVTEQKAENAKVASATESRAGLVDAMRKLFAFLPLHYGITQSAELADLIGRLQAEADRF